MESPRSLGLVAAAAIVIANMIGTGVFTSAGFQAAALHDASTMLVAWVVGGALALCGATAYAELGAMMPRAGGEYVYLREAYHPAVGFLSGWVSLLAGFSAPIAVAALAFARYAAAVLGEVAPLGPDGQRALAVALVLAMTALHGFDAALGGRVQAVLAIGKAALIAGFVAVGVAAGGGDLAHFAPRAGGLDNVWTEQFAVALMYVGFAYSGWNAAAYIAGELRDPQRTLPRALLLGTAVVTALYLLLNATFLWALGPERMATGDGGGPIAEVGDAAARALLGDGAGQVLSTLIALGLCSAVSAMVMAGPRVYAAMADDGALPALLARRTARGVPLAAVLLQGGIAVVVVLVADLGEVMQYVGFLLWVFAALAVGAVVVLRRTRPELPRPYRTVGYPVTPAVFVAASAWVTYAQLDAGLGHAWWGAGTVVTGLVAWAVGRRRAPAG